MSNLPPMLPLSPMSPICFAESAAVPGHLKALLWERMSAMRKMGSMTPMTPSLPIRPMARCAAAAQGKRRALP